MQTKKVIHKFKIGQTVFSNFWDAIEAHKILEIVPFTRSDESCYYRTRSIFGEYRSQVKESNLYESVEDIKKEIMDEIERSCTEKRERGLYYFNESLETFKERVEVNRQLIEEFGEVKTNVSD